MIRDCLDEVRLGDSMTGLGMSGTVVQIERVGSFRRIRVSLAGGEHTWVTGQAQNQQDGVAFEGND